MIGKVVTALAGRSIARTVGGTAAGPAGALIGAAIPIVLPRVARTLGPVGMIVAAVGGLLFTRWMERRNDRKVSAAVATAGLPPRNPEAVLGSPTPPDALEGELLRDRI
jgi:uncharacterized protein YqgC (DUF456 family)